MELGCREQEVTMTTSTTRRGSSANRPDPFREFADLYQRMSDLVGAPTRESAEGGRPAPWVPLADVSETEDAYLVEIDLPGVDRDDVDIEVVGNELTISGEIKQKEREGLFRKRTRRLGEFEFRAMLPRNVDPDGIEASLEDGVLSVRIAKTDQARPKRIEIKK
jgi:HSP20 family protein